MNKKVVFYKDIWFYISLILLIGYFIFNKHTGINVVDVFAWLKINVSWNAWSNFWNIIGNVFVPIALFVTWYFSQKQIKLQKEQWLNDGFLKAEVDAWLKFRELFFKFRTEYNRIGFLISIQKIWRKADPANDIEILYKTTKELLEFINYNEIYFKEEFGEYKLVKVIDTFVTTIKLNRESARAGWQTDNIFTKEVAPWDTEEFWVVLDNFVLRESFVHCFMNYYYEEVEKLGYIPKYESRTIADDDKKIIANDQEKMFGLLRVLNDEMDKMAKQLNSQIQSNMLVCKKIKG